MMNNAVDVLFFALVAACFGTIIWCNITEASKALQQFKEHECARARECKS